MKKLDKLLSVVNVEDIKVRNSGLVRLQHFEDFPDGNLSIGEALKNIPFEFKRFYFINALDNPKAIRGKHAHKKLRQVIFCINGEFTLHLDDGETTQDIRMNTPFVGVILNGLVWHEMTKFTPGCVILVLAENYYDKEDYVRDYGKFLSLVKKG